MKSNLRTTRDRKVYMQVSPLLLLALFFAFFGLLSAQTLPSLPIDFESTTVNYSFVDFDGGLATKIANPHPGGMNTSANVARMVKNAGQPWAGSYLNLAGAIDFSVNKTFKVKVYMPRAGAKMLLKVENQANPATNFEREATATVANAWEELTFDYSAINAANQYDRLVFIFDLGTVGNGSADFTYLFDDIRLVFSQPVQDTTQMNLPVTFDIPWINYGVVGFGGADASSIEIDPTNPSNKVAKVIKSATAELWAGTTITATVGGVQTGFASKIPFTETQKKMNVRVWSPHAGIVVRLKAEDYQDPTKSVETDVTNTVANNWEILTFDFGNQASGTAPLNLSYYYNKVSIFFNFGVTGAAAGERTYYFDDVKFGEPTSAKEPESLPADFVLLQNYPNPFNPSTAISYYLPAESKVRFSVYNSLGQQVANISSGIQSPGYHTQNFNSNNLPSGIYFYAIEANSVHGSRSFKQVRKMSLLK